MAYGVHASSIRFRKVMKIFSKFDVNRDGHLNREEMSALVVAVNPKVDFDDDQIAAILDEVFRTYGDYIDGDQGLSFDGLLQTYHDGAGDIDRDFKALGLDLDKENGDSAKDGQGLNTADATPPLPDVSSRRKEGAGAWAQSPTNGIACESTWKLVEELETQIRQLEAKMGEKMRSNNISSVGFGWARNADSTDGSATSQVIIGQRPWEELGLDYLHFQTAVADVRKKADQLPTQEEAFDAHMASGRTLFDHRLYKEALISFKRAGELIPTDVRPHFQEGNTLFALGKMPEAKDAYTLALYAGEANENSWDTLLPQIHVNLGIALESEGLLFAASNHYKEAAIKEPKHYRALKLLGSALYGVGEYKAAKEALLQATALCAGYADAHCELGSVLHALGDDDQAITEFEKALDLKADHMEALYNLATLLKDIGDYRRAATTYSKVLAVQPDHWRAQLNRAASLLGAGDIDESKRAFKVAYKLTGRSELHDAIVHLQHMENRPQGLSSFFGRGDANLSAAGDNPGAKDDFIVVEATRFRRVNARTTPRKLLAFALDIRQLQKFCRFNRCDVSNLKKELNQIGLPVSSPSTGIPEKLIRKEPLEKVLRNLLPFLKPEAFQGAMKLVNERILSVMDLTASGRVDVGMVFAVLALICGGSLDRRKRMAFDALVFRSSRIPDGEISKQDAKDLLKVLRAAYLRTQEEGHPSEAIRFKDHASLSFPEFVDILDNPDTGFGVLNILAKLEAEENARHRRQLCSVCSYPIIGPGFKETKVNFSLCASCYSSGKVPAIAKHEEYYHFKEFNSDIVARLQSCKSPFTSCSEL
ncbi:hypothetical protein L7F22_015384 [Adiantum nelumboides]|nr:hypothetical protein [Adiantum nelumboides]